MIRFAYLVEILSITAFFYNCLILLIATFAKVGPGLQWWFLSLLAMVVGIPLSWLLWYKSLWGSANTDGATYSYMKTFLLILIHIAWCAWMIVAVPGVGSFSAGEAGGVTGKGFGWSVQGLWVATALGNCSFTQACECLMCLF